MNLPAGCAGRFRVEGRIASGGYGVMLRATQLELGRVVALKLLHREHVTDREQVLRFIQEARVTASLRHPGIVQVLDHGVDEGIPWIAYELLPGPSLRGRLADGPLGWPEAARIAAQIARALAVAHEAGVLHRDVKPDNVIAGENGVWKLADFGIARWREQGAIKTASGLILGSPAYLSPEQCCGDPPSECSDVYALGATLFELLTGEAPHGADDALRVIQRRLNAEAPAVRPLAPGVPAALDALVQSAMARKPTDRLSSAAALAEALERMDEGSGERGHLAGSHRISTVPASRPGGVPSRPAAQATRHVEPISRSVSALPAPSPVPYVPLGVAAVLTALALGFYLGSGRPTGPAATASADPSSSVAASPAVAAARRRPLAVPLPAHLRQDGGAHQVLRWLAQLQSTAGTRAEPRTAEQLDHTIENAVKQVPELLDEWTAVHARELERAAVQEVGRQLGDCLSGLAGPAVAARASEESLCRLAVAARDLKDGLELPHLPDMSALPDWVRGYLEPDDGLVLRVVPGALSPRSLCWWIVWQDHTLRHTPPAFDAPASAPEWQRVEVCLLSRMMDKPPRPVVAQWFKWHMVRLSSRAFRRFSAQFAQDRLRIPGSGTPARWIGRWQDLTALLREVLKRAAVFELPTSCIAELHAALMEYRAAGRKLGPGLAELFDLGVMDERKYTGCLTWSLLNAVVQRDLGRPDLAAQSAGDALKLVEAQAARFPSVRDRAAAARLREILDAARRGAAR